MAIGLFKPVLNTCITFCHCVRRDLLKCTPFQWLVTITGPNHRKQHLGLTWSQLVQEKQPVAVSSEQGYESSSYIHRGKILDKMSNWQLLKNTLLRGGKSMKPTAGQCGLDFDVLKVKHRREHEYVPGEGRSSFR